MYIGIITILKVGNYGAELQAYATQKVLNEMGHKAEIIDYLFYKNQEYIPDKASRPSFHFPFKRRIKERFFPIYTRFREFIKGSSRLTRDKRFETFHRENTPMSITFHNVTELVERCPSYDVYITGSDQVWNPYLYSSLEPYLLAFTPDNARRLSYASSFGVSCIPKYTRDFYMKWLRRYDAIGVRENNAVAIVADLTGKKAECVLDPTLLLPFDRWMEVSRPVDGVNTGYVLVYELTPMPDILRHARRYARQNGCDILRVCKDAAKVETDGSVINIIDAGPAEFLWLFANATAIFTNSFHGSAFAINFGKEFYTFIPNRKENNSRQINLLNMFDLNNRLIAEGTADFEFSCPDFSEAAITLDHHRSRSLNFLRNAIECK